MDRWTDGDVAVVSCCVSPSFCASNSQALAPSTTYQQAYAEQAPTPAANATIGIALAAASVGIGAIAIGLSALSKTGTGVVDLSQFKSLTDYAAAFAAEL